MPHSRFVTTIRYTPLILSLALIALTMKADHSVARAYTAAKPNEPMPGLQGQPAIDYLKQHGLFESVKAAVEAGRHEIKWLPNAGRPGLGGAYQANNSGQNLRASFSRAGALITPHQSCAGASWQMAMKLRGVGYGERLSKVAQGPMRASGNRIEFQKVAIIRSASGPQSAIVEWYVNKPEGIEQGFTLSERPGVTFGNEPLRLALSVMGGLRANLEDGGQTVALAYPNGRQALRYDHLAAYDAVGRSLPARMEVSEGEISLLVDDANAIYPVTIDPLFTEVKKLSASDGVANDSFGFLVAISGDTAIVGAYIDDSVRGAAYVFTRNQGGANLWGEVKKLTASDGAANGQLGISVAISGNRAITGAIGDDGFKGAAYVFERNQGGADNWGEVKKLIASGGAAGDQFGYSVAIDGDTAIVGAYKDDSNKGSAYVFERNQGGADNWGEVKKLTASDGTTGDYFGVAVAMSADTAIVGAHEDDSVKGAAYLFARNQGGADNWGEVKKLAASDGVANDTFGVSVALSDDRAIVGAYQDDSVKGAAYVFEQNRGGADNWGEVKKLTASDGAANDGFGYSVALSGDTALIGAYGDNSQNGAAYVFKRNQGGADVWGEVKKLTASDGGANDYLGYSVAISGDTAIVGAWGDDGQKGSSYMFASDCNWAEKHKPVASDGVANDQFGYSVGISGDTVIVGAYQDDSGKGSAYIFERNKGGADLWGEVKKLIALDGIGNAQFGRSVAISGDTVIAGAWGDDGGKGSAYIFERNKGGADFWGEVKKLTASDGEEGDLFGISVAISGDTAIAGAFNDDVGINRDQGSAYLFARNQGGADLWGQIKKLVASDGATNAAFGRSVAISGDIVIVVSPNDDSQKGSAYIFERNKGGADIWGQVKKLTGLSGPGIILFPLSVAISGDTAIIGSSFLNLPG
ncbi:MAG: FG-GAP repeat protein, partial [Acidobacteriota bacterium]|nr:FG-GAP repeat protein [Acidobacteriota bacterium]